ncbi:TraR/DksA C4-type zinc finger protein, partial [Patescibacteria group bacterium]|nr:TraR/DksA C4-type zinc finger protein [Patescibacteria group bacterium]
KMVQKKNKKTPSITFPMSVLQPIKNFLKKEERRLVKSKKVMEKSDPFQDEDRVNDNAAEDTDAAEQVGHAQVSALKRQLDKRLIQVRKALSRLKIGHYAFCEKCGQMIDTDRLMIKPEATTCVSCERKQEG